MDFKRIMMGAVALALVGTVPAIAQTTTGGDQVGSMQPGTASGGAMQSGSMPQSGTSTSLMQDGSMTSSTTPKMTAAQTRSMQKCQAMSSTMMAKNKTCARMMKMHPEMSGTGTM